MKVKLISDFREYYDHHFDLDGTPFVRKSSQGPDREEMLFMMFGLGLAVPTHGTVEELHKNAIALYESQEQFNEQKGGDLLEVVVYTDTNAHRGEGKLRMKLNDALAKYPTNYAAQYVPNADAGSKTWRFLAIGDTHYWLEYKSTDDWRSNAGNTSVRLLGKEDADLISTKYHINIAAGNIRVPLYAIDFVPVRSGRELIAVDFNTAPGLNGTPIQDTISGEKVAALIKAKMLSLK